jgi:hypothetical protein
MSFLRSIMCVFVLLQPFQAWADTVWLNNGDRLTGEILLLDGGKLALKTKYAGQVLIAWKDVDTLSSDKPLMLRREGFDTEHSNQLEAADKGMVKVVNAQTQTIPLVSINRLIPPRTVLKDRVMEGNLDAKLDMKRDTNQSDEWKLKGDSRMEHGRWRHVLSGELERKIKNDDKTADNWQLEYNLDRFITDNWFWRVSAEQEEDEFDFFTRQRSVGTGPGYRFWDNELGRLDVIAQLNNLRLETEDDRLSFKTASFGWDYKRLLFGTRVELYSTGEVQIPQIDEIDYVLDSEYGLRYRLNEWARLSLLYELDQARGLGQTSSGRRYLLGVGVGW